MLKPVEGELQALLLTALAGDNAAYAHFLRACGVLVRSYFRRRLTAFPDDVEDLVQETLLAVHNQRNTYRPALPLTPWLYAIARHKLVDSLRLSRGRAAVFAPWDDDAVDATPHAGVDDHAVEARRDLMTLLTQLPDRFRLPIVLVKVEGHTVAEAALLTGMSASAVKVGIHRGLRLLARRAGERR